MNSEYMDPSEKLKRARIEIHEVLKKYDCFITSDYDGHLTISHDHFSNTEIELGDKE